MCLFHHLLGVDCQKVSGQTKVGSGLVEQVIHSLYVGRELSLCEQQVTDALKHRLTPCPPSNICSSEHLVKQVSDPHREMSARIIPLTNNQASSLNISLNTHSFVLALGH